MGCAMLKYSWTHARRKSACVSSCRVSFQATRRGCDSCSKDATGCPTIKKADTSLSPSHVTFLAPFSGCWSQPLHFSAEFPRLHSEAESYHEHSGHCEASAMAGMPLAGTGQCRARLGWQGRKQECWESQNPRPLGSSGGSSGVLRTNSIASVSLQCTLSIWSQKKLLQVDD